MRWSRNNPMESSPSGCMAGGVFDDIDKLGKMFYSVVVKFANKYFK